MTTTTTIAYAPAELTLIARQADEAVAVGAGWATADRSSLGEFEVWWDECAVSREAFDRALAADGVDDRRDFPEYNARNVRVRAVSECGGGSEAIHWFELSGGDFLGVDVWDTLHWHVPSGDLVPVIEGYEDIPDPNADPDDR